MALAYGNFHELSHQLRFLLFEIGIGLPQNSIDYFITLAHRELLNRLQQAALMEGLINAPIASHHVHDFINQLEVKLKDKDPSSQFMQWNRIRNELDESIANEALVQAYKQYWQSQLQQEVRGYRSLWSWINETKTPNQSLLFLDQWGNQDIPYHPTFRARIGFTRREVLQNSPEFQSKLSIHWCALRKTSAYSPSGSKTFNDLIAHYFPREYLLWQEKLIFNHLNPTEYAPIPVHPWQWRNKIQKLGSKLIDNKSLLLLPHHQTVMPTYSFNSMAPAHNPEIHIKIETTLQTSETGNKNNDLIQFGSQVSQYINSVLGQSQNYQNTLFITEDVTSIRINDDSIPEHSHNELSTSLYTNPIQFIHSNQRLVPLGSLFAISPITHIPLIIEIIQASGLEPIEYFQRYCRTILHSQLHLLLKFGIAFASSPNNSLVIFSNHLPQGLVLRDLNQLKINNASLLTSSLQNVPLDSSMFTKDLNELLIYFIQGTLQNNISRWVHTLGVHFSMEQNELWRMVNQSIQTLLNELSKNIEPQVLDYLKHQLLKSKWPHQCLLTMQLKGKRNNDVFIKKMNPLDLWNMLLD